MGVSNGFGNGEPEPGSVAVTGVITAEKPFKYLIVIFGWNTDSGVGNGQSDIR